MKASIKTQTEFQPKLMESSTTSNIRTDEIYTNLLIQHGRNPLKEDKNSERAREECLGHYGQVSETLVKNSQEIFIGTSDNEENPKSILITGKAGIGKTLFCQKLIRDWADEKLFQSSTNVQISAGFKFAYLLTFRQLNLLGDKPITLKEILNCSSILDDQSNINDLLFEYILNHPEEVLIIIDGFDEFSQQCFIASDAHERYPNSSREKMPVAALCAKLMRGQILGQSTVMITSRPDESDKISGIRFDRNVEVTGFSKEEVKKYIENHFRKDEAMKTAVLDRVMNSEDLVSFAHIPVLCALMCSYMEYILNESKSNDDLPVSKSDLYFEVLNIFELKHDKNKDSHLHETTLDKLMEFAAHLLVEKKFVFSQEDMKRFSAQEVENLRASGLLNCGPPFRVSYSQTIKHFCFTHLTLHEYLAACWFVKRETFLQENLCPQWFCSLWLVFYQKKEITNLWRNCSKNCRFQSEIRTLIKQYFHLNVQFVFMD